MTRETTQLIYAIAQRRDHFRIPSHTPIQVHASASTDSVWVQCSCGHHAEEVRGIQIAAERSDPYAIRLDNPIRVDTPTWVKHRKALNPLWNL